MIAYDDVLGALGDRTRRRVLELLRPGPRTVGALAEDLPVSRPAVSQHLRVLKQAGLVHERVEGTRHIYGIDARGLEALRGYVEQFWGSALDAFAEAAAEQRPRQGSRAQNGRTRR